VGAADGTVIVLPGQQFTPDEILAILRRRKWVLIVPFLFVTVLGAAGVSLLKDQYRSETVILVVPQRVPEAYVKSTVTARIEDRLSSIQQQIFSRSRLEKIILDFDLYKEERQRKVMEDVVADMRDDVRVMIERGDAFRVLYTNDDPRLAQRVTERLATLFIDENLRERENLAEGTSLFLDTQLEDARRQLIEQEKRLEAYNRQYAGQLPSQVQPNMQALHNANLQLQQLSNALDQDRQQRLALDQERIRLESPDPAEAALAVAVAPNDRANAAMTPAQRLKEFKAQLLVLEQRYKPGHPDIVAARRAIRAVEAELAASGGSAEAAAVAANPAAAARLNRLALVRDELRSLDFQIERKQDEQKRLRAVIASYQAKLDAAPTRESELTELMRDYSTMESNYRNLLAKREDSRIAANLERRQIGEQFKVLDPARLPEKPFQPNRPLLNAAAAIAGLAIGAGLVVLLEVRDTSLRTAAHVATVLNLPVLALVPTLTVEQMRQRRRRRAIGAAIAMLLLAISAAAGYLIFRQMRGA
jgi:polysaccharide chain length determinant protein (PEP-CTERM system associated)